MTENPHGDTLVGTIRAIVREEVAASDVVVTDNLVNQLLGHPIVVAALDGNNRALLTAVQHILDKDFVQLKDLQNQPGLTAEQQQELAAALSKVKTLADRYNQLIEQGTPTKAAAKELLTDTIASSTDVELAKAVEELQKQMKAVQETVGSHDEHLVAIQRMVGATVDNNGHVTYPDLTNGVPAGDHQWATGELTAQAGAIRSLRDRVELLERTTRHTRPGNMVLALLLGAGAGLIAWLVSWVLLNFITPDQGVVAPLIGAGAFFVGVGFGLIVGAGVYMLTGRKEHQEDADPSREAMSEPPAPQPIRHVNDHNHTASTPRTQEPAPANVQ